MDIALGPACGVFTQTETRIEINTDEMSTVPNEDHQRWSLYQCSINASDKYHCIY